jgi:multicomponent Na+:H+ antiporter subunit C
MSLTLAFTAAALFSIGTYLVLQRKLSRIIIGIGLLGHGANILFLLSGRRGTAPIIGTGDPAGFSDPLPQAMVLTAIVITFAVTAFLLALAYRSWLLTHDDEVEDDVTDRLIAGGGGFEDEEMVDVQTELYEQPSVGGE